MLGNGFKDKVNHKKRQKQKIKRDGANTLLIEDRFETKTEDTRNNSGSITQLKSDHDRRTTNVSGQYSTFGKPIGPNNFVM